MTMWPATIMGPREVLVRHEHETTLIRFVTDRTAARTCRYPSASESLHQFPGLIPNHWTG